MRRITVCVLAALLGGAPAGCGGGDAGAGAGPSGGAGQPATSASSVRGNLTVLAAASLTASFTTLGARFEKANPGVEVTLGFGGSSALATQIASGAPADVFASASPTTMDAVVAAGAAADPRTFAVNAMQIAVPPGNPGRVTGVASLASPSVKTAVCQPQVPCGATAQRVLANAEVAVTPVTLEPDVKSVLSKVQLDEVDAGLVYVTDVLAAGAEVEGIEIPPDLNASTSYPIAALTGSANADAAAAFVAYVLSPDGQAVLTSAGFRTP